MHVSWHSFGPCQSVPSQSVSGTRGVSEHRTHEGTCHRPPWLCSSSPSGQIHSNLFNTEFPGCNFQCSLLFISVSEYCNPWGGGGWRTACPPSTFQAIFSCLSAETRAKPFPDSVGETNHRRSLKQDQHLPPCAWRGLGKKKKGE